MDYRLLTQGLIQGWNTADQGVQDARRMKNEEILNAFRKAQTEAAMEDLLERKRAKEIAKGIPTTETTQIPGMTASDFMVDQAGTPVTSETKPISSAKWLANYGQALMKENPIMGMKVKEQAREEATKPFTTIATTLHKLAEAGVDLDKSKSVIDGLLKDAGSSETIKDFVFNKKNGWTEVELSNGQIAVVDGKGSFHAIPEKQATEWGLRDKASKGDKQAISALDQKHREDMERERAKETKASDKEDLKAARDNWKERNKDIRDYRKKKADLDKQWAKDKEEFDEDTANTKYNEAARALERDYAHIWDDEGQDQQKSFDVAMKPDKNGAVDEADWNAAKEEWIAENGSLKGFMEFMKGMGITGIKNISPAQEKSGRGTAQAATLPAKPKTRKEYFDALRKANPKATDKELNDYLDRKKVK